MDAHRFDALARLLSARLPRRASLAAAAAVFGLTLQAQDAALGKNKKKKCRGNTKKCGKRCIPKTACCEACGSKTCCNGVCVDLATDPANCGACNRPCVTNSCIHGACECETGETCPTGCKCSLTIDSSIAACGGPDLTSTACDTNTDCDLGAVCRQTAGGSFCGKACLG